MISFSLALCFSGFTTLCLAMSRHWSQVFGANKPAPRCLPLQIGGGLILASALGLCIQAKGVSVGIVQWLVLLSLAAFVLVGLLTYRPRMIIPLALGAPLLTLVLGH